jgi:signal transduction histidine kinase
MSLTGNPMDIFFHKMPMGAALFDRQLILRRCNSTWTNYIVDITHTPVVPGTHLFNLLPGTESIIQSHIDQALAGEMTAANGLRLSSGNNVFFWDTTFAPWIEEGNITGFLQVVTDVTERVLSRQLLERRVTDRTRKLSALYDVMTIAAEPLDLKEILQQSLQRVLAAAHAQAGAIQLLVNDDKRLFLAVHQGFTPTLVESLSNIPAYDGLSGWTAEQQQPLVLTDIATDRRTSNIVRQSGFRAYVGVPMNARGRVLGVLSAFRETRRPFSQEDISLLDSVADQIGTAVENARLRLENEQLLIVEERNRLSRELHDAITQSLYSLALFAETGKRFAENGQLDLAGEYIEQAEETAQQALREMRLLLHNLRPAVLEKEGLVKAIQQRMDAVEKRVGMKASFQVEGEIVLPVHVEEALYQIIQEALNNALKHATATEINVYLCQQNKKLALTVKDNGHGFDPDRSSDSGGLGLTSMRERVESLNGVIAISSETTKGSQVQVNLDLDQIPEFTQSLDILDLLR